MNTHPVHSKDPDVVCRWICESAGNRSYNDNLQIQIALDNLNLQKVKPVPFVDMIKRVK